MLIRTSTTAARNLIKKKAYYDACISCNYLHVTKAHRTVQWQHLSGANLNLHTDNAPSRYHRLPQTTTLKCAQLPSSSSSIWERWL
jgi:hypothetical protein